MQKIEIFRASNGFTIVIGHQGTAEMLVFSEWDEVVEYLSTEAGLWGKRHIMPEVSPNWETAPDWAVNWVSEAHFGGADDRIRQVHHYSEQRPEAE